MQNFSKGVIAATLISISSFASAQWSYSGGYTQFNEDDDGFDISLGAIYGSVGYTYESNNLTFMPELRLGLGVGDDEVFGVDVEIDTFFAASVRAQFAVNESFALFLQPSYARLEVSASANNISATEDDWEFGLGGGAVFKVSETTSIEASYENFDNTDVLSVAARFKF